MSFLNKLLCKEIELYGEKDIYSYFNQINEKFESKIFSSSDLEGSIMSTEPLIYKIRSSSFPNDSPQLPDIWKTSIRVVLQKKQNGTWFTIYPKTGVHTWIVCSILTIVLIIKLIEGNLFKQTGDIIGYPIGITAFYLLDLFAKQNLVYEFKDQILYK